MYSADVTGTTGGWVLGSGGELEPEETSRPARRPVGLLGEILFALDFVVGGGVHTRISIVQSLECCAIMQDVPNQTLAFVKDVFRRGTVAADLEELVKLYGLEEYEISGYF